MLTFGFVPLPSTTTHQLRRDVFIFRSISVLSVVDRLCEPAGQNSSVLYLFHQAFNQTTTKIKAKACHENKKCNDFAGL